MADVSLSTGTSNAGLQTTTQSPQSAGQAGATGTPVSSVQPVTPASYLSGTDGVPLQQTGGVAISLTGTSATTTTTGATITTQPARHVNPVLAGFAVVLFVIAAGFFWYINRSSKNTTV